MPNLDRFAEYAAAFEESFEDDDWARLEQYFTDDATYCPGDGTESKGRASVLATLKKGVDSLDRNFDSRTFGDTPPPTEDGNVVTLIWALTFAKAGVPDLTISGCELLTYQGAEIQRMEDIFDEGVIDTMTEWMGKHGG